MVEEVFRGMNIWSKSFSTLLELKNEMMWQSLIFRKSSRIQLVTNKNSVKWNRSRLQLEIPDDECTRQLYSIWNSNSIKYYLSPLHCEINSMETKSETQQKQQQRLKIKPRPYNIVRNTHCIARKKIIANLANIGYSQFPQLLCNFGAKIGQII